MEEKQRAQKETQLNKAKEEARIQKEEMRKELLGEK
jgi:hypothetical protein